MPIYIFFIFFSVPQLSCVVASAAAAAVVDDDDADAGPPNVAAKFEH